MTAKKYTYTLFYCSLLLLLLILLPGAHVTEAARSALLLCARSLVPSLIAPLILSGILSSFSTTVRLPGERFFVQLFHLPATGLSPFLLGALCGFPVGAKVTAELYREGLYDKEEAVRIAALSANTGPAFAVAAVGNAFFCNAKIGWLLYLTQMLSAILLGIIDAQKHPKQKIIRTKTTTALHFSLPDIIYRASLSLLTITGTVVFFGVLCNLPARLLPKSAIAVLGAILEVGNGSYQAAQLPLSLGIPLAAFSISFSGISVLSQNAAHLIPQGIPLSPIVCRKLLQGILAALLAFLLFPIL